jgi:hypothetical protein
MEDFTILIYKLIRLFLLCCHHTPYNGKLPFHHPIEVDLLRTHISLSNMNGGILLDNLVKCKVQYRYHYFVSNQKEDFLDLF